MYCVRFVRDGAVEKKKLMSHKHHRESTCSVLRTIANCLFRKCEIYVTMQHVCALCTSISSYIYTLFSCIYGARSMNALFWVCIFKLSANDMEPPQFRIQRENFFFLVSIVFCVWYHIALWLWGGRWWMHKRGAHSSLPRWTIEIFDWWYKTRKSKWTAYHTNQSINHIYQISNFYLNIWIFQHTIKI